MISARLLVIAIVPVLTAGGLLLSSVPGHAEAGREDALGFWPAASDSTGSTGVVVAQADPHPRVAPVPPVPPVPPIPPVPPVPPRGHRHGMSVRVHDGKIEIDGVADMVQEQLDRVTQVLDQLQDVPPDVREKIKGHVQSLRDRLHSRLARLRGLDIDQVGPEVERLGDELEKEMDGLSKDLAQLDRYGSSIKFNKDFTKGFAKTPGSSWSWSWGPGKDVSVRRGVPNPQPNPQPQAVIAGRDPDNSDSDDDDDDDSDDEDKPAVAVQTPDDADSDAPAVVRDLSKLSLAPDQKSQLAQLRNQSNKQIEAAKRDLEQMTNRLHDELAKANANADEVGQQIDAISRKEAEIRKARVLTWLKVRNLLNKDQRAMVEKAAKKTH